MAISAKSLEPIRGANQVAKQIHTTTVAVCFYTACRWSFEVFKANWSGMHNLRSRPPDDHRAFGRARCAGAKAPRPPPKTAPAASPQGPPSGTGAATRPRNHREQRRKARTVCLKTATEQVRVGFPSCFFELPKWRKQSSSTSQHGHPIQLSKPSIPVSFPFPVSFFPRTQSRAFFPSAARASSERFRRRSWSPASKASASRG